ncbi:hypothetical protein POSPLADRAFT_1067476 [Postia placenta MAD-698-R-SB12]|uniref:Uncharacterized protein n=1 Tax=Postia placenta MAD-698-R-SB12 TaxID=670580 RepID=A0A1X6MQ65_9APHY|nr:hypothetical protein POSPLADRAFT_1067476 [Postia placenta MAD-698-R-SB12]OSX58440.1 hypothetical protein POSPLADRAFT_1067476 [Postia placenta MAD-698-R-SB12]
MAYINQQWLFAQLPRLMVQPTGTWGISYDVYTRPSEDPIPSGWQSHRSKTYCELLKWLRANGFVHHQYSDHRKDNVMAVIAFLTMIQLVTIPPFDKLSTTIKGLKMHYIDDMALLDVTDEVRLGGNVSPQLSGPAPRGLVHNLVGAGHLLLQPPGPVPQGHPGVPPRHTRRNAASRNVNNYVM